MTPDFFAIIFEYSFSSTISGASLAFTTLTIAFVPFSSIPIHEMSFLFNLILFAISWTLIFSFFIPTFNPASFTSSSIPVISIFESICIFIFQTYFVLIPIKIVTTNNVITNIFLFLYLCNKNGIPLFWIILTLHFNFFAIFTASKKSFIPILRYNLTPFSLFKFHIKILLVVHIFINLSI